MNHRAPAFLCGMACLLCLLVPVMAATSPLWTVQGEKYGELAGVVISDDGSTILTGGHQIISLDPEGRTRWEGWSAGPLAVSGDGDYILSAQGQVLRLISAAGSLTWEKSMDIAVTDIAITENASLIAATGGGRTRLLDLQGEGIALNITLAVNHIRILPPDQIVITSARGVQISNRTLLPVWTDYGFAQDLIEVSPVRATFVTATDDRVRLYDRTGSLLFDQKFNNGNARCLAISRDGSTIVTGTDRNQILAINRDGSLLWRKSAGGWITGVAVSDDGDTIVAGAMDSKMYVYDRAGALLGTFTARTPVPPRSVGVSHDGSLILLVDDTAIYAFSRASFAGAAPTVTETPAETPSETPTETAQTTRPLPAVTFLTFTPIPTGTEETPINPAVPLAALGILVLFRPRKP